MEAAMGMPDFVAIAAAAAASGEADGVGTLFEAFGDAAALAAAVLKSSRSPLATGPEALEMLGLSQETGIPCAVWRADGPSGTAIAFFVHDDAARAAVRLLAAEPETGGLGAPLPEEAALRLSAAAARPALARHWTRSAADALARHALELAASLPGSARLPGGAVVWAGAIDGPGSLEWIAAPGPGLYAAALAAFLPGGQP